MKPRLRHCSNTAILNWCKYHLRVRSDSAGCDICGVIDLGFQPLHSQTEVTTGQCEAGETRNKGAGAGLFLIRHCGVLSDPSVTTGEDSFKCVLKTGRESTCYLQKFWGSNGCPDILLFGLLYLWVCSGYWNKYLVFSTCHVYTFGRAHPEMQVHTALCLLSALFLSRWQKYFSKGECTLSSGRAFWGSLTLHCQTVTWALRMWICAFPEAA